jgi:hypothetical protein
MAERRFADYPSGVAVGMWSGAWKTDKLNAQHWLALSGGVATLEQSERMAEHLVWQHWSAIVRVAQALADAGELIGAELERCWRGQD